MCCPALLGVNDMYQATRIIIYELTRSSVAPGDSLACAGAGQAANAGEMPPDSSDEEEDDAAPAPEQKVVVFGGGVR